MIARLLYKVFYNLVFLALLLYLIMFIPVLWGYRPLVIISGSMEPILKVGGVTYYTSCSKGELNKGDIVVFKSNKHIISHRVQNKLEDRYIVKGDANPDPDLEPVYFGNVMGQAINFSIPYIGYYLDFIYNHKYIIVIFMTVLIGDLFWNRQKKYLIAFLLLSFINVNDCHALYQSDVKYSHEINTIKYQMVFNANGGKYTEKNGTSKLPITVPIPLKDGYKFVGYTDEKGKVIENNNFLQNSKLNAKWEANKYSISYDLDGGKLDNMKVLYSIEDSFTLGTPQKNGYTFLGWTGPNNLTPTLNLKIEKQTGNVTYKANWSKNKYTVTIYPKVDGTGYINGKDNYTFNLYANGKMLYENIKCYQGKLEYGTNIQIKVNSVKGYSIISKTEYNYVVNNDMTIIPEWKDDIPPTITSFSVKNLGFYDPNYGLAKGYNIEISVNAYDEGTGISKYQTWLMPYRNGTGAEREDGNIRLLKNVLYLNTDDGRTFCAYAIDKAGNEASACETIKV